MSLPQNETRTPVQPVIRASELGSYAFCPLAWYLRRQGWQPDPGTEARLALGNQHHRAIGRRADGLRLAGLARRGLLLLAAALAGAAALASLGVVA